ncbi:MAG: ATP-dependent Clp protease proteolytic subunit [Ruminococcus sp.]|nr:ATP-dependent Clp protease proteolytic subunit [Ruminococcus sp.]
MYFQTRTSGGISLVPLDSKLLTNRKFFIEGEIDTAMANEFLKAVMLLHYENDSKPIDVIINSPGGEINAGLMMYDIVQTSKAPIRTFCVGKAYSMAAVLLACGNNGRYILPHGELMLHEPLIGNRVSGSSSSIKSISDSLLETKHKINKILAKHTGKTEKAIERATSFDHFFSAQESIDFGLCDEIVSFEKVMEV